MLFKKYSNVCTPLVASQCLEKGTYVCTDRTVLFKQASLDLTVHVFDAFTAPVS